MSEEHKEDTDDRGALVLPPKPVARGAFALLVPGNMRWRVSEFAGGFRLDFLPLTAKDRVRRRLDREEP